MSLIYSWYFEDSVAGYIAVTHRDIFNRGGSKKTIIVSLRGTKDIIDTYTDMKIDTINYSNLGKNLPFCGHKCRVHSGFHDYYTRTLSIIHQYVIEEMEGDDEYELLILGHSLGGSVALLLGLHYLDLGVENLLVVTMGQPLLGNEPFVQWTDQVMDSSKPADQRKFIRVVHKKDIITVIPSTRMIVDSYTQFNNLIYMNCSSGDTHPSPNQVVDCRWGDNPECINYGFLWKNP
ncbi:Lipase A [Spathaspora sp. JA1]|nr:Lipase A [Spathaspora sp. JA1]